MVKNVIMNVRECLCHTHCCDRVRFCSLNQTENNKLFWCQIYKKRQKYKLKKSVEAFPAFACGPAKISFHRNFQYLSNLFIHLLALMFHNWLSVFKPIKRKAQDCLNPLICISQILHKF